MRDHSNHVQVTREKAVELLRDACEFDRRKETIPVQEACGRVLAEDAKAQTDIPNCLECCLDSVAVHYADFENGMPDTSEWVRGVDWEFANTGVGMPEGFDTAIVIEHVTVSDDERHITIDAAPSAKFAGTNPQGSKMRQGEVLAFENTLVTADIMARMAMGGVTDVSVIARPTVAFIPTGNELTRIGDELKRGGHFETNGLLIAEKIRQWGGEPVLWDIVPDDCERITAAICEACTKADIVVVNAGSSKGSDDWNIEMLDEVGTVLYHQTNHGPGHHSSAAVVDGTPVVGISGPPRGAGFTADFYLRPVIKRYLRQPENLPKVKARLASEIRPSGPGAHKHMAGAKQLPGEVRPSENADGSIFYGVKFMIVRQAEDGVLEAVGVPGKPGGLSEDAVNGYYMMPSGAGVNPPQVGDFIEVDLKPWA